MLAPYQIRHVSLTLHFTDHYCRMSYDPHWTLVSVEYTMLLRCSVEATTASSMPKEPETQVCPAAFQVRVQPAPPVRIPSAADR
jgi:hypothetical protein